MKIALVSPIEETVPPLKYGGTEWIVYYIAHGMAKKGHQVDLYAAGNSKKDEPYTLVPIVDQSIRTLPEVMKDNKVREVTKLLTYSDLQKTFHEKQYDIIHNHAAWRFLLYSQFIDAPIVSTVHSPLSIVSQNLVFKKYQQFPFISISHNQRRDFPDLNFVSTVYNGINLDLFPFDEHNIPSAQAPMVFLARFSPEKGPREAIQVAHTTKRPLQIASKVDTVDAPYFDEVKQQIDGQIVKFEGEIGPTERARLLAGGRCLFVPIQWEEPFGLMFIESMACGSPVITYARGAAPEIVVDGETGFLVNQSDELKRGDYIVKKTGVEGLAEAVEKMYTMSDADYAKMRLASRKRVAENFTVERMVDGYEQAYQQILKK